MTAQRQRNYSENAIRRIDGIAMRGIPSVCHFRTQGWYGTEFVLVAVARCIAESLWFSAPTKRMEADVCQQCGTHVHRSFKSDILSVSPILTISIYSSLIQWVRRCCCISRHFRIRFRHRRWRICVEWNFYTPTPKCLELHGCCLWRLGLKRSCGWPQHAG